MMSEKISSGAMNSSRVDYSVLLMKDLSKSEVELDFDTMPRTLDNGDISLPFSACFVFKKIEDFNPEHSTFKVAMTMILRIKLTGIEHMKMVKDHIKDKMKVRIQEEESLLRT